MATTGKGAHKLNGPTEVKALYFRGPFSFMAPLPAFISKGPTEVKFKHVAVKNFSLAPLANLFPPRTFKMMVPLVLRPHRGIQGAHSGLRRLYSH